MVKRINQDDYWLEIFDGFKASGLSQRKFCIQHNHPLPQFKYYWEKLVQKPKRYKNPELASFAPITLTPSPNDAKEDCKPEPIKAVIDLPNKIRCSITIDASSNQLAQLLKQLVSIC